MTHHSTFTSSTTRGIALSLGLLAATACGGTDPANEGQGPVRLDKTCRVAAFCVGAPEGHKDKILFP